MQVYFKHKPIQIKVQLLYLKDNPHKEFYFKFGEDGREYSYCAKDIPLSDDFELVYIDEEFTVDELQQIERSLRYNNCHNTNLMNKIQDKIIKLWKYELNIQ